MASPELPSLRRDLLHLSANEEVESSSHFIALRSPASGRTPSAQSSPVSSYEIPLMAAADTPSRSLRLVSASSAGRTHGSRPSEAASDPPSHWHRRAAPSAVSAHSSRPSNSSTTQQQCAEIDDGDRFAEIGKVYGNNALPSCNYYVDASGQMRIRKLWWCYMRMRRVLWVLFPWLKRDSNTYLCAKMVANSTLIVVVYLLRELLNHVVVPAVLDHRDEGAGEHARKQCHDHSLEFLDMYAYSLVANVLLCLPALNFKACRLYRRARRDYSSMSSTASSNGEPSVAPSSSVADITKEHQHFEKTYLFTLCEIIVVCEIPYLIFVVVVMFVPSESGSLSDMLVACDSQLATGYFLILLAVQLVSVLAYVLRWRQILFFHRLHQHFLFQRGYVPGHSRFDYVERSFATPLYAWLPAPVWGCWKRYKRFRARNGSAQEVQDDSVSIPSGSTNKQIHFIKVALYSAAKRGDVEQVRSLLEAAVSISGPEFAAEWYEPRTWRLGDIVLFARGQRNPLHVAVAFDQIEVVRELLANGHFDVQQLDKLELLRLDLGWIYRLWFSVLFFVVRRSSAGVVVSGSAGSGAGNGGAAPGLASASHPFGPVGLFQATLLTPLHVAVTLGYVELTLLLLRYGAKPDATALCTHPRFATPPLYWAVDKECTRLLLDAGGNPLALPAEGNGLLLTAFEVARIAGNAAVARQMEKYGGDVALTPLHDACACGRRYEVEFLLEHGADPDTLGEQVIGCFRRTPLHWAAMRGHARIIRLLVQYGANVDARDVFGRTPLAWACVLNRTRAVEALLDSDADVNVRDAQGDPLLCICAAGACASIKRGAKTMAGKRDKVGFECDRVQDDEFDGGGDEDGGLGVMLSGQRSLARGLDPRIFQLLLDYGVDLHATRTSNGDSALHVALRRRNQSAAVLFVRAGLSLTAVNLLGQRAIDCARSPALRFAVKKEAGQRDVMISYSHAHAPLARKIRDALERQRVTTWIDTMGPTGITGGSVWRQEIARGIQSSALVLAVLTKDYPQSQWCMKELAFAKMQNIPVVAIQCEDMEISEELQVYLWTRQVIDFRPAVKHNYADTAASIPYPLSEGEQMVTSNSSRTMDTDSREDESGFRSDDDEMTNMMGKRIGSSLELVPDYNDEAFCHCLRMLLDGIQDQIEEHRARLARRQEQEQQQAQLPGHSTTDGDESRHGSRRNDSECYPDDENKGLCGIPAAPGEQSECEDTDASNSQISFPEGPLNVPLFRPLRRIGSLSSSLAFTSTSDAFVFIAHGDFHRSFCLHLQKSLLKQGIRCVVDQTVPAVQYAHQPEEHVGAEAQSGGFGTNLGGLDQSVARLPVQTRQLAAKDAILSCSAVLVVLSPLSANCDLLADQLAFAEDRGKLLVPVLLSLHKVDLAKRYTFSRSMVHQFNVSLGYEQSMEQLTNYLRAQQQIEARQRRLQRRQQEDHNDLGASLGAMAVLSPISSASSVQSRRSSLVGYTEVVEIQSPFDEGFVTPVTYVAR
ncbi:Transmembrane protein [Phytophthora megakarya]|uniref:Transmembrane protein n=1 Tax=Phytophthora megakarya TaxID=4795 RepID=A0A225WB63_9STRA|nr:Transmembrane protein [Phytophthora megakarya]